MVLKDYDVSYLPVGTKFWVQNGHWDGEIIEVDGIKHVRHAMGTHRCDGRIDRSREGAYGLDIEITEHVELPTRFIDKRYREDGGNAITDYLDSITHGYEEYKDYAYNYFYGSKPDEYKGFYSWTFRHPGASRGGISFDLNGVITEVVLHRDTCGIYKGEYEEILDRLKEFVGCKIVMVDEAGTKTYFKSEPMETESDIPY